MALHLLERQYFEESMVEVGNYKKRLGPSKLLCYCGRCQKYKKDIIIMKMDFCKKSVELSIIGLEDLLPVLIRIQQNASESQMGCMT